MLCESRVAQLNLVEKRGIIGTVTDVSANQVTVTDIAGNTRNIDVDEITKFSSPSTKSSFGLSDLTKGTKISVLGNYNKDSKRILARFISVTVDPTFLTGAISDVDRTNFTITMAMTGQKQQKIDIQSTTKISVYTKDQGLTKYGFSKMNIGDRLSVVGFPSKTDKTLFEPDRIIVFTELPKDPKVVVEQVTPSSGSGKTLTPITK